MSTCRPLRKLARRAIHATPPTRTFVMATFVPALTRRRPIVITGHQEVQRPPTFDTVCNAFFYMALARVHVSFAASSRSTNVPRRIAPAPPLPLDDQPARAQRRPKRQLVFQRPSTLDTVCNTLQPASPPPQPRFYAPHNNTLSTAIPGAQGSTPIRPATSSTPIRPATSPKVSCCSFRPGQVPHSASSPEGATHR